MSAKTEGIIRSLRESLKRENEKKTSGYDTRATIRRIEDGVAWVHIPGGVDETPVQLTINASVGDQVQVRVSGGRAFLVGNASAPPTDNAYARQVNRTLTNEISNTNTVIKGVQKVVQTVKKIADNTNQYFWHTETGTDTGAHITEIPQEEFLADPENGGGNLLARSNGIAVRDGLDELATFGADEARIGKSSAAHSVIDADGQRFYASNGTTQLANIGYGEGASESGTAFDPYYTFGTRVTGSTVGNYSFAEGRETTASGYISHAEGYNTTASGDYSHAEGRGTTASDKYSHAEGRSTTASQYNAHAEGYGTTASGDASHAEGSDTTASGSNSHAEGDGTIASGRDSHAGGLCTDASYAYQTVIGKYNASGNYPFIVGNGASDTARSNAITVDWDGNVECTNLGVPKSLTAPTLTKSSGNSNATVQAYSGYGKMRMLILAFTATADVPAGTNVWAGTISSEARPYINTGGCGYVGSGSVLVTLTASGSLVARMTGTQLSSGATPWVYLTYFVA